MTKNEKNDGKEPRIYRDEFPRELNPELFKPHFDIEEEERLIMLEEQAKKGAGIPVDDRL